MLTKDERKTIENLLLRERGELAPLRVADVEVGGALLETLAGREDRNPAQLVVGEVAAERAMHLLHVVSGGETLLPVARFNTRPKAPSWRI